MWWDWKIRTGSLHLAPASVNMFPPLKLRDTQPAIQVLQIKSTTMDSVNGHGLQTLYLRCRSGGLGIIFSGIVSRLDLPVLLIKEAVQLASWKKDTKLPDYKCYLKFLILLCKLHVGVRVLQDTDGAVTLGNSQNKVETVYKGMGRASGKKHGAGLHG